MVLRRSPRDRQRLFVVLALDELGVLLARAMRKFFRLLKLAGVNAVPGLGFLADGWSATTTLMLYWWETFFGALLLALLFRLYRRQTRGRAGAPNDADLRSVRSKTLGATLLFTIPQGYFLGAILVWISQEQQTPLFPSPEVWRGLVGVGAFLVLDFCADLIGLGNRPLEWLTYLGGVAFGRMIVMQFTIIIGGLGFAMLGFPRSVIVVFMTVKLLLDLAYWWPSSPAPEPVARPSAPVVSRSRE